MKLRNRTFIRLLARIMALVFRCLFLTIRKRLNIAIPGFTPHGKPDDEHRSLFCLWHDGILGAIFCERTNYVAALVSQNYDGTVVADILDAVGIQPIRGSSSRGGASAIKQLQSLADQKHLVIATDGPRGPRHQVKDGIVYLSSQSGLPIVPVAISCSWAWRPKGRWTDMLIPMPFSQLYILGGEPIRVPQNLKPQELGPYRDQLQQAMNKMQQLADRIANGSGEIWPDPKLMTERLESEQTDSARAA